MPCNAVLQSVQGVPRIRSDLNPATWCVDDSHGCCCIWPDLRPSLDNNSPACSGSMRIAAELAAAWPCVCVKHLPVGHTGRCVKHLPEGHTGRCQQQACRAQQPSEAAFLPAWVSPLAKKGGSHGSESATLQSPQPLTLDTLCCRMLEVTTPGMESQLGVDFAEYYNQSPLAK